MKEYKERFIWNNFIDKLKDNIWGKFNRTITDMIVDSSDEEIISGNNGEIMPNYNSLYNETFFDDNDMILD